MAPPADLLEAGERDAKRRGDACPAFPSGAGGNAGNERSAVMHDAATVIETDVPARLDRLPWTRFHTLVVIALGITWILDGLEVTIAGSIAGALQESPVLRFTAAEVGLVSSAYLAGAVSGAVLFGYLTDRFGRKRLFMV